MEISERGIALIAEFEGFVDRLYNDPAGHCTIGFGFLVHLGRCDSRDSETPYHDGMTFEEGLQLLNNKVRTYSSAVRKYTLVPLTQNQFDALTSFCYNVGAGGYAASSVLRVLNAGQYHQVCSELEKYIRGTNGIIYPGLVRRRAAECALFSAPAITPPEEESVLKLFGIRSSLGYFVYVADGMRKAYIEHSRHVVVYRKLGLWSETVINLTDPVDVDAFLRLPTDRDLEMLLR